MDRDKQLLATARDCFYFVTKFFEVIRLSAPHIYHSALELSPQSAIVRKLYYHHHPHPKPRVVRGVPSSWNLPSTINTNHKSSTWSPCGKFLAVVTSNNVEIWDILTLEKCSTLKPANLSCKLQDISGHFPNRIAYSPDGRSLACYSSFSTAIIIWEIQTGGVVKEIGCEAIGTALESLVWSFNGNAIGVVFAGSHGWVVCVCDVALGTIVALGTLQSWNKPFLWPHDKLFRILTTLNHTHISFGIYEVGPTLFKTGLFSITLPTHGNLQTVAFSPTTHQISIVTNKHMLFVFSSLNSKVLLQRVGSFHGSNFSSDGSFLMAYGEDVVHIWECVSNCYTLQREIPFQSNSRNLPQGFQCSPTFSSILISRKGSLEVIHLGNPEARPPAKPLPQYRRISANGTYIVTADQSGSTITITNFYSQTSSWFININFGICGLALTGNVLLAEGADTLVAWQLTEEGAVKGVLSDQVADMQQNIWCCHWLKPGVVEFLVIGDMVAIRIPENRLICYNTDTGECYKSAPTQVPIPFPAYWHTLTSNHTLLHNHHFYECNDPLRANQPTSIPSHKEGWVRYPEGEHPHRFWLLPHWMADCEDGAYWLVDIEMLWLNGNELAVINF